ncbi:hypothetical protein INR49_025254 [Caranx melampygus]|nr:hypothetical protein INR49_025254 [Caranx melampygus]
MLRSTGFFRGIDCPFYAEYSEGKGSRNGCNRPYCHFRHSQQRRPSYGAPADVKKQRDLHSTQREQGYDPFNPEVVRPQEQQNGKPAESGDITGALELVNKAIEEVRSEVEREKRKLSRFGDEPYDPSESGSISSSGAVKNDEYVIAVKKPQEQSVDTKKYTFSDSDGESSGTEYRPTSLSSLQQRKGNTGSTAIKQKTISSSNGKRLEDKRQSLSLSHADLFGDESPDEVEPMEVDDNDGDEEEDEEDVLVRKSADALKRGRLNKRKASELTPSSSDDEGAGKDEVVNVGIDLSSFQDDLDFDSDPMEECLRIFNESKDVKREDKGRQTKQTEAPSKTVVRPYKRPSAQEVCYQRMQMAQEQAAQLSASVKAASQSSSPGFSRERKKR